MVVRLGQRAEEFDSTVIGRGHGPTYGVWGNVSAYSYGHRATCIRWMGLGGASVVGGLADGTSRAAPGSVPLRPPRRGCGGAARLGGLGWCMVACIRHMQRIGGLVSE